MPRNSRKRRAVGVSLPRQATTAEQKLAQAIQKQQQAKQGETAFMNKAENILMAIFIRGMSKFIEEADNPNEAADRTKEAVQAYAERIWGITINFESDGKPVEEAKNGAETIPHV